MPVYLDYNATAPVLPEAAAAVAAALQVVGNPSSVHGFGRAARRVVEAARADVAALVGVAPEQVVFTGSGTEAAQLALTGVGRTRRLVSALEHAAVRSATPNAELIPATPEGVVDLAALERLLAADPTPTIVSLMLANNETGVIQPVAEAAALAHRYGAVLHTDAVQAVGRIPVDLKTLGADLLSLSAHKLGGPAGAGALVVRGDLALQPLIRGGGQERGRRGGTEATALLAGFGVAARSARLALDHAPQIAYLLKEMEAAALERCPDAAVIARGSLRLPNTSLLAVRGCRAETLVMALDLAGYAVSAGAACSSGSVRSSAVLAAMGVPQDLADGAIRISLGPATTAADVAGFVDAWAAQVARTRRSRSLASTPTSAAASVA
ncbi:MAG: cysteine desulfurase [Alphaproteobacteria bacterium]|nr:cysteine desulfurase family protein [Alphaproteobacteria bacterium]TAD88971.1 MAG: cysteine desulfurase [Alphaproteobacteria bacterium]